MNDTTIAGFAAALAVPPVAEQERMVEALLFASRTPLTGREIEERLPRAVTWARRWPRSGRAMPGAGSASYGPARAGLSAPRPTLAI